jgi:RNA polymerase sigma factor (TIGR02999 family)
MTVSTRNAGSDATALLGLARNGDHEARSQFVSLVYEELRRLAHSQRQRVGGSDTVNTTALVHEAYEKLMGRDVGFNDRRHFFGFASRAMRDVLVDHARAQAALKRGGPGRPLSLVDDMVEQAGPALRVDEVIGLDAVLERLASFDPDGARVVELRYFAGLTLDEVAELTEVSVRTVKRRWTAARAWLHRELSDPADGLQEV